MAYEPKGTRFFDVASNREMLLVAEGESFAGWLCYRHPDGQWVSLRKANKNDLAKLEAAEQSVQADKCPSCKNGIIYDAWFDKWFNCSDCAGTGIRR